MKLRIAILFGGRSGEHEVSLSSANSVVNALDKSKYEVVLIGIDKSGRWLKVSDAGSLTQLSDIAATKAHHPKTLSQLGNSNESLAILPSDANSQIISNRGESPFGKIDVLFPVLHGPYGEDGTVQGLLELANIPYVGSGVLGSAVCMDKDVSRRLLREAGIPVVPTLVFRKHEFLDEMQECLIRCERELSYPFFVKPANMGSSVGVGKAKNRDQALACFKNAFEYDLKVLAEKAVSARELECSILGHRNPKASVIGEIVPQHEFYSYEAKYLDENGALLKVPASDLSEEVVERIQTLSLKAFRVLECSGMARVDFFLDRNTNSLFLNEINTIPGFTKISMYPKLWEASGLPYSQLLDELIELSLERHRERKSLSISG